MQAALALIVDHKVGPSSTNLWPILEVDRGLCRKLRATRSALMRPSIASF